MHGPRGVEQCCCAVRVGRVGVYSLLEQPLDRREVALSARRGEERRRRTSNLELLDSCVARILALLPAGLADDDAPDERGEALSRLRVVVRDSGAASLSADDRSYWASCVVGSIHAAYTGYQALALLDLPFWPGVISIWDDFGARHIEWELVLLVSLGFFVFDFALTLCSPGMQGQKLVAVHHLLTLGIHSSIPRYGMFAALSAMGYLAELSTPLVNGRVAAGTAEDKLVLVWDADTCQVTQRHHLLSIRL